MAPPGRISMMPTSLIRTLPGHAWTAIRSCGVAGFAVLALSIWWAPDVPLVLKAAVTTMGVFAAIRPAEMLLVVAALTPLTRVVGVSLSSGPARVTEALVLAYLAGALLDALRGRQHDAEVSHTVRMPVYAFGALVLASVAVLTLTTQVWHDYPSEFYPHLGAFLARDYLVAEPDFRPWGIWPAGLGFVASAALLIEGGALLLITARLTRRDTTLAPRLLHALVAGAVGAALLSVAEFAGDLLRGAAWPDVWSTFVNAGWARHINKVGTAGSYFTLLGTVSLGLAMATGRWRGLGGRPVLWPIRGL